MNIKTEVWHIFKHKKSAATSITIYMLEHKLPDGTLFDTVATSRARCREQRDLFLSRRQRSATPDETR